MARNILKDCAANLNDYTQSQNGFILLQPRRGPIKSDEEPPIAQAAQKLWPLEMTAQSTLENFLPNRLQDFFKTLVSHNLCPWTLSTRGSSDLKSSMSSVSRTLVQLNR